MSAADRDLDGACGRPRKTSTSESSRHHRQWPPSFPVQADEFTAYFTVGEDTEVQDLLDRAGVYRRRFDLRRKCWAIPVGEFDNVVKYARAYNGRTIYVDTDEWGAA